jgi:hypothetical protein
MVCDYAHGQRLEWYAITLTLDSIEEAITVCDYARDRGCLVRYAITLVLAF